MVLRSPKLPPELLGPIAVDALNVPRFWPTVWADSLKASSQLKTRTTSLGYVDRLYKVAAVQRGRDDLDRVLYARDFDALEAVLMGFQTVLRNEGIRSHHDYQEAWSQVLHFVQDIMRHMGASAEQDFERVSSRIQRLERLYSQISPTPERWPMSIESLRAVVVHDLYSIFRPGSNRNPFRELEQQVRNQLIFIMLLHLGLRRSELRILPVDAIKDERDLKTGALRYWSGTRR